MQKTLHDPDRNPLCSLQSSGATTEDVSTLSVTRRTQHSQLDQWGMLSDMWTINISRLISFGLETVTKDSSLGKNWSADLTIIDSGFFNMLPALHFLSKALLTARKIVKTRKDRLGTVDNADANAWEDAVTTPGNQLHWLLTHKQDAHALLNLSRLHLQDQAFHHYDWSIHHYSQLFIIIPSFNLSERKEQE